MPAPVQLLSAPAAPRIPLSLPVPFASSAAASMLLKGCPGSACLHLDTRSSLLPKCLRWDDGPLFLDFSVSELIHLASFIPGHSPHLFRILHCHTPTPTLPCFLFRPLCLSRPASLLSSKPTRFLRASPTVTWRILHFELLLSKTCSFPLGIAPTPVPSFLPANSLPNLTWFSLPGLGGCSYPGGRYQT